MVFFTEKISEIIHECERMGIEVLPPDINESFADWMCAKIVDQTQPEFRISLQQFNAIRGAMRTDSLPSVQPIRRPLTARDDPLQLIDEITYSKGKGIPRSRVCLAL